MFKYRQVNALHLEMTTRCNALCPMCPRTAQGGKVNPIMPIAELTASDCERMFEDSFINGLERMYMCGNYGDAMAAKDTLEVFERFRRVNPKIRLLLYTNGSGRDEKWWRRLAETVDGCTFAIDGLEDTNHLYRRGTEWKKVMASVKAFIAAGGKAEWAYLVFKHNEHQVDAARKLAADMGFVKFVPKRTDRFMTRGKVSESLPVLDENGAELYKLEMPTASDYRNAGVAAIAGAAKKQGGSYAGYLAETKVCCKVEAGGPMYVTAEGLVFPCCWLANLYAPERPFQDSEIWDLIKTLPGGADSLNALKRPLQEIVDGEFFQKMIPERWQPTEGERKKLTICARICGQHDPNTAMKAPEDRE